MSAKPPLFTEILAANVAADDLWSLWDVDAAGDVKIRRISTDEAQKVFVSDHIGGNFTDTTDQAMAVADTPQSITFNQNRIINDISHVVGTDLFTINTAGVYQLTVAPQLGQASGTAIAEFWIEKNGTPIVDSGIQLTMPSTSQMLPFLRWKELFAATDTLKIIWASDSVNSKLDNLTSLFGGPNIPSIMLGITHVGN